MQVDQIAKLTELTPLAIAWAEAQQLHIAKTGQPLDAFQFELARSVGVLHPEMIRIAEVASIPLPENEKLRQAALATGLISAGTLGMTLGYGIYVHHGHASVRLLSHEFRHVYQYEQAGSIANFLPIYLQQIASTGYEKAPLEIDARAHEMSSIT